MCSSPIIEGGQLLFVSVALALLAALKQIQWPGRIAELGSAQFVPAYAIGGLAAFWTIRRVLSFVAPGQWNACIESH